MLGWKNESGSTKPFIRIVMLMKDRTVLSYPIPENHYAVAWTAEPPMHTYDRPEVYLEICAPFQFPGESLTKQDPVPHEVGRAK